MTFWRETSKAKSCKHKYCTTTNIYALHGSDEKMWGNGAIPVCKNSGDGKHGERALGRNNLMSLTIQGNCLRILLIGSLPQEDSTCVS